MSALRVPGTATSCASLSLDRRRGDAFDATSIAELAEAFVDVGKARAVVLSGEAELRAGADVEWMRSSIDLDHDANVADATALRRMLEAIDSCPAPVVAQVQATRSAAASALSLAPTSRSRTASGPCSRSRR